MTVADIAELIVRCLENEGVTHVFGIPGEENIHLLDALARSSIRYVLVRHEQAASFMAEVYGRLTGAAGVCSATLGPGAINLVLGVADAMTNSTPVVALSAQVGMNRAFKESHQGVDLVSMFNPVTKWSALVATPEAVPEMIRKAFKLAQTERPGSVYLAIPEDVQTSTAPAGARPLVVNRPRPDEPSPSQLARAVDVLQKATNPIVLAGHGAARAGASSAVRRFAEKLVIPVATTFHGKGVLPDDHPQALGAVGFMRHDYVNFGFDQADAIVAVGYELQEIETALREGVPFTVLVWVDDEYGLIKWKMELELGRSAGMRFGNPDFVTYAESFGARGYRIGAADELLPALHEALALDTVSVIACPVDYSASLALTRALGELDESLS